MKIISKNLTFQVVLAIISGILVGIFFPGFADSARVISKTFINMISMLIAPIIFFTIVLGIARMGDMKKIGRVGGKALLYFEVVTTIALFIGMVVANFLKPGVGCKPCGQYSTGNAAPMSSDAINWVEFLTHIVSPNIFESFAKGEILQILFFAILFGFGMSKMGSTGSATAGNF